MTKSSRDRRIFDDSLPGPAFDVSYGPRSFDRLAPRGRYPRSLPARHDRAAIPLDQAAPVVERPLGAGRERGVVGRKMTCWIALESEGSLCEQPGIQSGK